MRTSQLQLLGTEPVLAEAGERFLSTAEEESRVEKLRQIMGRDLEGLSDAELEVFMTEFGFLLDSWLDEYEQTAFAGKTLKQLLREG
jgi:hypothetical protein